MIYSRYGRTLGIVLAGGKGERLMPLTKYRAKPAVPFAAKYRIIDFALSNLINSGLYSVYVLVQFKSQSLNEHVERGWQFGGAMRSRDFFVTNVPAQMWTGNRWYEGTADSVYQNLHLITLFDADHVCIFAADHIYKMDVEQMLQFHVDTEADITVAANNIPASEASSFGCIGVNAQNRITSFVEKPENPPHIPGKPGYSYVSMGNYIFKRNVLEEALIADAADQESSHDFGKNILTKAFSSSKVMAYDFSTNKLPGNDRPYWQDVGTIKAYWQAHIDLLHHPSDLTLFNFDWPIRTVSYADPPGFTYPSKGQNCSVVGALQAEGSQVLGASVHRSVLSRNCIIHPGAVLEDCIIGQGVVVRERCKLRKVIVDAYNEIPPGTVIGYDPEVDAARFHYDEVSGVTVVPMPSMRLRSKLDVPDTAKGIHRHDTYID